MNDLESMCDDPNCPCGHYEPQFRPWLHIVSNLKDVKVTLYKDGEGFEPSRVKIKEDMKVADDIATQLATFIAKTPCEARCKALAQTKLQECLLWFKEGIEKEIE